MKVIYSERSRRLFKVSSLEKKEERTEKTKWIYTLMMPSQVTHRGRAITDRRQQLRAILQLSKDHLWRNI
jgi:hypothetical protein